MLLGYPLKETVGIVVPVLVVWAWNEHREGRRSLLSAAAPAVAAAVAFVVGVAVWRQVLPAADAAWPVTPDIGNTVHNLTDIISLAAFVVGTGPLLVPSFLVALGICGWSFITVDLTPRLFWIGFPFAATLTARWFSEGRPKEWLDRLPLTSLVGA
jgi:hypothetical protein